MVIRELLREAASTLKENNIENAVFEANLTVRTVLGLSPIDTVLSHDKKAPPEAVEQVREFTKRRCLGEPLQYILGTQEFMGLELLVNENVLIPRADTEALVEAVLEENRGMSVLDICTGSGCIGISIAHYNKRAYVLGLDISEGALEVAARNAQRAGVSERVRFERCDIMHQSPKGVFDVIVSNPPYIKSGDIPTLMTEVKNHEPDIALDGGEDGLDFYRRITKIAPGLLQESGRLYFEVGFDQARAVAELMEKDFSDIKITKDLCGVDRVVSGVKRGRK